MIAGRLAAELLLIAVASAIALGFGVGDVGIASGYRDPVGHYGAQDEAVYAHEAIRMVRDGGWGTPIFLGRLALNKPPLLMWCGAAAMRVFGVSPLNMRLPVVCAGALCCALAYFWLRTKHSSVVACCGVMLLAFDPIFHSMSRKFMTDVLLLFFLMAAMAVLVTDSRLERRWSAVLIGLLSGAAIMTKSAGGLLPLLVLVVWFVLAGGELRAGFHRILIAGAVAIIVAAPWHVYQLMVHREWFLFEYVGQQLFQSGVTSPSRLSSETTWWFYVHRLLASDPILVAISLSALPGACLGWKQGSALRVRLLAAWTVVAVLVLAAFASRIAYYLLPLVAALALMSCEFSPLFRGRRAWAMAGVLAAATGVKAWSHNAVWGLDYRPGSTIPSATALDRYSRMRRSNELVVVNPNDEFYSIVLDLPKVRYLWLAPTVPIDDEFRKDGLLLNVEEFCQPADVLEGRYGPRVCALGFPDSSALGTTVIANSLPDLARVIGCSPTRDFFLSDQYRTLAAGSGAHFSVPAGNGRFFLLANTSMPEVRERPKSLAPDRMDDLHLPAYQRGNGRR